MWDRIAAIGILMGTASTALAQPVMDVSGSCPGIVDITVTGATPNKNVVFMTGGAGSTTLAAGACAGTTVGLNGITVRFNGKTNGAGTKTLSPNLAAGACATLGQWLDITTCQVSDVKSLTPSCTQVDVSWIDTPPVAGPPFMADPAFVAISTEASVANGLREDFEYEDPAGNVPWPASLYLDFYDGVGAYMCSALFDVSGGVSDPTYTAESIDPATGLPSGNPVVPLDPILVTVSGGFTDCDEIDPAGALGTLLGSSDLRDLAIGDWQFGYNMISGDLAGDISSVVGAASYNADYAPYIIGESLLGLEYNFAATYDRTCEVTHTDVNGFLVLLPKPVGAVTEHGIGFPWWAIGL